MAYNPDTMSFDLPDTDTVYISGLPPGINEKGRLLVVRVWETSTSLMPSVGPPRGVQHLLCCVLVVIRLGRGEGGVVLL